MAGVCEPAASQDVALKQLVDALLETLTSSNATPANSSLLKRLLYSSTWAGVPDIIASEDFRAACDMCNGLCNFLNDITSNPENRPANEQTAAATGLRLVPGCLQMLQNSYKPLETDTAIQPHLIDAVATFLKLAKTALLSKEWLQSVGSDTFVATAAIVRSTIKDCVMPLLCTLAADQQNIGSTAVVEPYEQLISIGRLSADMIAGRPQYEQAAELRSFAVLNLAWSSVVKLLMVLATAPNQNVVAKGFHVARLLQLLTGYLTSEFDVLLRQPGLNQLKVVRFWAQHALKLYSTFRTVSEALWGTLAGALAHMHQQLPPVRSGLQEQLQAVVAEVQQHVTPRFGKLVAACIPNAAENESNMSSWLHALCHEADAGRCPYPAVASQPIEGRFMVMLDVLQHGGSLTAAAQLQCAKHALPFIMTTLCAQLSAQACNEPALRKSTTQAVVLFMAACCGQREGNAWQACELFLFRQAMLPHPIRLCCLEQVWGAVVRVLPSCKKHHHRGPQEQGTENRIACRRSAKSLAASHISTLHQLLSAAAVKSDPSVALQHMNRQPVRQLVQLTAHLVRAADPAQQQAMCDSMLKTAGPVETSVNQAAALAVTFRVLQLVSRSCNGVMQLPKALQRLQEVTQAAQLTSDEISCWHLLAIANGLQYCQQAGIQVAVCILLAEADCYSQTFLPQSATLSSVLQGADTEAYQILKFAVNKIRQAPQHSQTAVCALQVLVVAQHTCSPEILDDILPGLLKLQQDQQAAALVAAIAGRYAEAQTPPVQLFHALLEEQHWALQHEAMEGLLLYIRSPKAGDFRQILPRSLYNPESQEGPSAAFGALVKDYMQRPPPAAPAQAGADFAQHCHRLEHQSSQAVKTVTVQQSKSQRDQKEPVCQQRPPNKLEAAIASASQAKCCSMQAMQELSQCLTADIPGQADGRGAQTQTQLMLLAQIAQQCASVAS